MALGSNNGCLLSFQFDGHVVQTAANPPDRPDHDISDAGEEDNESEEDVVDVKE